MSLALAPMEKHPRNAPQMPYARKPLHATRSHLLSFSSERPFLQPRYGAPRLKRAR